MENSRRLAAPGFEGVLDLFTSFLLPIRNTAPKWPRTRMA